MAKSDQKEPMKLSGNGSHPGDLKSNTALFSSLYCSRANLEWLWSWELYQHTLSHSDTPFVNHRGSWAFESAHSPTYPNRSRKLWGKVEQNKSQANRQLRCIRGALACLKICSLICLYWNPGARYYPCRPISWKSQLPLLFTRCWLLGLASWDQLMVSCLRGDVDLMQSGCQLLSWSLCVAFRALTSGLYQPCHRLAVCDSRFVCWPATIPL